MQVYTASTSTSELKHNAHNENNKPIHQNIQYTQNRFKQVNWTSKNYVHVVHVVIVPLLSLYQCHCFCQIGLLTVLSRCTASSPGPTVTVVCRCVGIAWKTQSETGGRAWQKMQKKVYDSTKK